MTNGASRYLLRTDSIGDIGLLSGSWDEKYWVQWHTRNWALCIPASILYVIAVHLGVMAMKNRKPYDLRAPLGLWSAALGVFSIFGTYNLLPELLDTLYRDGFQGAACNNTFSKHPNLMFWGWLFVWSKLFEFGDTAFIVLRKQKLTFLHWFHHAMTLICVFAYFPGNCSINRWTGSMNYLIHSLMYSYYALRAFRVRIPRPISVTITTMQIMQMLIGLYVASFIFAQKLSGQACKMTMGESVFSFAIYTSYFVLFLNFFIRSYFFTQSSIKPVSNVPTFGSAVSTVKSLEELNEKLLEVNGTAKISSSILNEQTCRLGEKKVQ